MKSGIDEKTLILKMEMAAKKKEKEQWYGVDLDGTLAMYDGFKGPDVIGDPIPAMLARVKRWLAAGKQVRIMTARVSPKTPGHDKARKAIRAWLKEHLPGYDIPITHKKDYLMKELWDDKAVTVEENTGKKLA